MTHIISKLFELTILLLQSIAAGNAITICSSLWSTKHDFSVTMPYLPGVQVPYYGVGVTDEDTVKPFLILCYSLQ